MLQLNKINKSLNGHVVLQDIELSLPSASRAAIIGPSGIGKTTLLRLIAGLERPDSGEIIWSGQVFFNSSHWLPPWRRSVGMVFQDLALWPHLTAKEHIVFVLQHTGRYSKAESDKQAVQILHEGHLEGLEDRYPSQLSGGQQQRLALVRALAASPALLLLDEAFTHFDPALEQSLWANLLAHQSKAGTTIIFVTHDSKQVENRADSVFRLSAGRLESATSLELVN